MGDVLKIRDEYRQIQRAAAIQECKASGLTNKEYCIQHGLSEKSFYYWKKSKRSIITRPRQKNGLLQNSFLQQPYFYALIIPIQGQDGQLQPKFLF